MLTCAGAGSAVGAAVGSGVGAGVGAGVAAGVAEGVGAGVAVGVGAGVAVGSGVAVGVVVGSAVEISAGVSSASALSDVAADSSVNSADSGFGVCAQAVNKDSIASITIHFFILITPCGGPSLTRLLFLSFIVKPSTFLVHAVDCPNDTVALRPARNPAQYLYHSGSKAPPARQGACSFQPARPPVQKAAQAVL